MLIYVVKCDGCGERRDVNTGPEGRPRLWHRLGQVDVCSWDCLRAYAETHKSFEDAYRAKKLVAAG